MSTARGRLVTIWMGWLQIMVPGAVAHELAHYVTGRALLQDARLLTTSQGRLVAAVCWSESAARWRRVTTGLAPLLLVGWLSVLAAWMALLGIRPMFGVGGSLWLLLNAVVLGTPSRADLQLAGVLP